MTIIGTSLYRDGRRNGDIAGDARIDCPQAPNEFVWIDLVDPTPDDLAVLQPAHRLSALAAVDVLRGASAPVFEDHGDHWFVGMPAAVSPTGLAGCNRFAVLAGSRNIITITYGLRRRGYRSLQDGENKRSTIDASDILYAHLSTAVSGYEHAIEALEEEVLSFAHQSLGPPPTPESYRLASRLRLRLKSIIEVLDAFDGVQDDMARRTGEWTGATPNAAPIVLSSWVRSLMQSAHSLLRIVDLAVDYRDCQLAHGQRYRWTLLSAGMMTSLIILVALQGALTGLVVHSSSFSLFVVFAVCTGLLLCTSILLLDCLNNRGRTRSYRT